MNCWGGKQDRQEVRLRVRLFHQSARGWGGWVDWAMQSALTDVLYIACYFILQEYWGVAKLKPGRYSNPSPAHISVGGWGLKSHLEVCSQYSSHPMLFMKGSSSRPLSRTHQSFSLLHATAPRPESPHRNTNRLTLWKNLNLDFKLPVISNGRSNDDY